MIHTFKGFSIVNELEVDIFLEFSCFFYDPMDVGNLISGSSAFPKTSLNIWKFTVRVLLKPSLENFEHYFASVWDECNCAVVWAFFGIAFREQMYGHQGDGDEIDWEIEIDIYTLLVSCIAGRFFTNWAIREAPYTIGTMYKIDN